MQRKYIFVCKKNSGNYIKYIGTDFSYFKYENAYSNVEVSFKCSFWVF